MKKEETIYYIRDSKLYIKKNSGQVVLANADVEAVTALAKGIVYIPRRYDERNHS